MDGKSLVAQKSVDVIAGGNVLISISVALMQKSNGVLIMMS
jgi:hypothetical protein